MSIQAASSADHESSIQYPGWQVAAAAFFGVMTSFSPIVPYTFSLFLNPLHAAFGWQRGGDLRNVRARGNYCGAGLARNRCAVRPVCSTADHPAVHCHLRFGIGFSQSPRAEH